MTLKLSYKAMFRKIITILLLSAGAYHASAEIRLPEIIGDGMVLQQQTSVNIWGLASGYATVSISASWNDSTYTTKCDADGHWLTKIDTPAGGMAPQSITISEIPAGAGLSMEKACSSVTVRNILIGEVWFCSGQSNMEMPLDGFWDCPVEGSAEEIALSGKMEGIRMATIPKTGFSEPQESVSGKWMVSSPENTRWFSATAYHFAKMLHSVLGVPIGIINCSWGGSTVEGWLPQEILSGYEDISFRLQTHEDGSTTLSKDSAGIRENRTSEDTRHIQTGFRPWFRHGGLCGGREICRSISWKLPHICTEGTEQPEHASEKPSSGLPGQYPTAVSYVPTTWFIRTKTPRYILAGKKWWDKDWLIWHLTAPTGSLP